MLQQYQLFGKPLLLATHSDYDYNNNAEWIVNSEASVPTASLIQYLTLAYHTCWIREHRSVSRQTLYTLRSEKKELKESKRAHQGPPGLL